MPTSAQSAEKTSSKPDDTDKRLERLRRDIFPDVPYLVDMYTPYHGIHLSPNMVENWRRTCPFDKHEEQLQYMTFLPHTLRGDTMLRTRGDWDDEDGKLKTESAKRTSGSSSGGISPLPGQAPKKKIPLHEYHKKRMAGQASSKNSTKTGSNEKKELNAPQADPEPVVKPLPKVDPPVSLAEPQEVTTQSPKPEVTHGQKRYESASKLCIGVMCKVRG